MERQEIFDYAKKVYGTVPEYLWKQYPDYAVLRIKETDKWYAVIMNVPRDKLGIEGSGKVEILNVKCNPEMAASLIQAQGFLTGYHMNKNHWISILLDGTVGEIMILDLLDRSYELIESCVGKRT